MISSFLIKENKELIGREYEKKYLSDIAAKNESSIIVVYGRRRVGKTELLEQVFRNRNILKFEGIEGESEKFQREVTLNTLAKYAGEPKIAKLALKTWIEVLEEMASYIKEGEWTLYFEEVQWLAAYKTGFIAALKYVWDNQLRHNQKLIVILCGSSPSFMVSKVLRSKALYNRSQYELHVKPFSFKETCDFLPKCSPREVMDAYLTIGGIPEYLKRIKTSPSLYLGICNEAFSPNGFFVHEYKRIFTSSLATNKYYEQIIQFLSSRRFSTREEILAHLKTDSGGTLSNVLSDLEQCGFITRYSPYHVEKSKSKLIRFSISDPYLQLYYKFIHHKVGRIEDGEYKDAPASGIVHDTYMKWLGFSFERYCQSQHKTIASCLGFSAVAYAVGPFFNRESEAEKAGFQIDLVFERQDKVITLCEVKYLKKPADKSVIRDFEQKLDLFKKSCRKSSYTIQKVLISAEGAEDSVTHSGYFDRILKLEDLIR